MNIDMARLMAVRPPKHFNNCLVSDMDPLSKGTIPREIEVVLPNADGSKVLAMWHGQPTIVLNDYVRVRRDGTDTNIFVIEGAGGSTGAVAGGNVEPKAGKCNIDDTEYATFDALIAALGSGILGVVGEGSFTTDFTGGNATLPAGALLRGRGINISNLTSADSYTLFTAGTFTIEDLTIANTVASGQYCFGSDFGNVGRMTLVRLENKQGNTAFFAGNTRLNNCEFLAGSGYAVYGYSTTGQILIEVFGGIFEGNIHADQDTGITLYNLPLINGTLTTANGGSIVGWYRDANGNIRSAGGDISIAIKVKNTSGATRANGDIGYVNQAGEFKTTTTATDANMVGSGCVVVSGGANNADIIVVKQGRVPINYTGTAPNAGDYLVSSASAGLAQQQTTMRPEIFAVCVGAGAAGVVEALLLVNRTTSPLSSNENILYLPATSTSDFVSTIAAAGISGDKIYFNAPSSGAVDTISPVATTELAKFVIHNTTRGEQANVIATGTDGTGNFIKISNSADISAWIATNAITARSQTNTPAISAGRYFYDMNFTATEIPQLTVGIYCDIQNYNEVASYDMFFHPYEANSNAKRQRATSIPPNSGGFGKNIPIINRRFCLGWQASGTGTALIVLRIREVLLATP